MHSVILHYQLLYRRWLPIIPVVLNWRGVSVRSEGYLDSGAFYSIFKISIAAELGLNISRAKERMFVTRARLLYFAFQNGTTGEAKYKIIKAFWH